METQWLVFSEKYCILRWKQTKLMCRPCKLNESAHTDTFVRTVWMCIFLTGADWCESVASAWHRWCVWRLSLSVDRHVVTWVARYWLISLLIARLLPWDWLVLPRDNSSSIYEEQIKIRTPSALASTVDSFSLYFGGRIFSFVCSCFGRRRAERSPYTHWASVHHKNSKP